MTHLFTFSVLAVEFGQLFPSICFCNINYRRYRQYSTGKASVNVKGFLVPAMY